MDVVALATHEYDLDDRRLDLARTLIVSIPTFVLFFAVQRFFVSGLRVTA